MPGFIERLRAMSTDERDEELRNRIDDATGAIIESDLFSHLIARTNATAWGIDEFDIDDVDIRPDKIQVAITFSASGAQEDDRGLAGDMARGSATATLDDDGVVGFEDIEAEVVLD